MKMKMMVEAPANGGSRSGTISNANLSPSRDAITTNTNNIDASKMNGLSSSPNPNVTTNANYYNTSNLNGTKYDPEGARFNSNNNYYGGIAHSRMDTNIIIVTASLLVVLVCSLCMHFAIRWALARFCFRNSSSSANGSSTDQEAAAGMKKRHVEALPTFVFADLDSIVRHVAAAKCNREVGIGNVNYCRDNTDTSNDNNDYPFSIDCCCPICLVDFTPSDRIRLLPCTCHHPFHVSCIDPWLCKHSSCPTCRSNLLPTLASCSSSTLPASISFVGTTTASSSAGSASMTLGSTTTININASSQSQPPTQYQLHILISPSPAPPLPMLVNDKPQSHSLIPHATQLPITINDKPSSPPPQLPSTTNDKPPSPPPNS